MVKNEKSDRVVRCPYCGNKAEYVQGRRIYSGRGDWDSKWFFACFPCGAWVGCHARNKKHNHNGDEPLGRLANAELRHMKKAAHSAFDKVWKAKRKGHMIKRNDAYAWLAEKLEIPVDECHIGMFDVEMCDRVIRVVNEHGGP